MFQRPVFLKIFSIRCYVLTIPEWSAGWIRLASLRVLLGTLAIGWNQKNQPYINTRSM